MNRSVIRTKKGIRKVFIEMLAEKKDVNKITVIELTDRVGIVRSTFYAHYKDIDDVAKEIQDDFVTFIGNIIDEYSNSAEKNIAVPISKMFNFFDERRPEYKELFSYQNGENQFIGELKRQFADQLFNRFEFRQLEFFNGDKNFEAKFYSYTLIGLIQDFLCSENNMTVNEITEFAIKLINKLY